MKKNWRKPLVEILILFSIMGNLLAAARIQNLESELKKEKAPSFEQALDKLSTRIRIGFSDWSIWKPRPEIIEYWPTWDEALENSYKFCSSGDFFVVASAGINNNFYMGVWNVEDAGSTINSYFFSLGGGYYELQVPLPERGTYIVGVNYWGVKLFFAFKVEEK